MSYQLIPKYNDKSFEPRLLAFFDADLYLSENQDVKDANVDPLVHFTTYGCHEGRRANHWFHESMVPFDLAYRNSSIPSYILYLTHLPGINEKQFFYRCSNSRQAIKTGHRDCFQCQSMSVDFDVLFYRHKSPNTDFNNSELAHFCEIGFKESKNPSPLFDVNYYLQNNPDVKAAGLNPFFHYLISGLIEGRKPRATDPVKYHILSKLRSVSSLSHDFEKLSPRISFEDVNKILLMLFNRENKICLSFSHDDYLSNTGGIQKFIRDESDIAKSLGYDYLHLTPSIPQIKFIDDSNSKFLVNCTFNDKFIGTLTSEDLVHIFTSLSIKREKLIDVVVLHSVMGWNLKSLMSILELNKTKLFFYMHDYFSLCHEWKLLKNNLESCGSPALNSRSCEICAHNHGRDTHLSHIKKIFNLKNIKIVFPSLSAQKTFQNASVGITAAEVVLPHIDVKQVNAKSSEFKSVEEAAVSTVRLAFCGHPSEHKGYIHFLELVNQLTGSNKFEFYHFGVHAVDFENIKFIKAEMKDGSSNMSELIRKNHIDIVFVGSIWSETFNFIAYEAAQANAALLAFNESGNVADFINQFKIGLTSENIYQIIDALLAPNFNSKLNSWKKNLGQLSYSKNKSIFSDGVM